MPIISELIMYNTIAIFPYSLALKVISSAVISIIAPMMIIGIIILFLFLLLDYFTTLSAFFVFNIFIMVVALAFFGALEPKNNG